MTRLARTTLIVGALMVAGCGERGLALHEMKPPPLQKAVVIERLALDGTVDRDDATPLTVRSIALPRDPSTFDHSRLLGDGTFYRLELEDGATLVRFADVTRPELGSTRLPLVAPPGQTIRSEYGHFRIATSSPGLSIDRDGRGSVWWEEDGPDGRHIEFRIDGGRAQMVSPGPGLGDRNAPVAHRFDRTPEDRELSFRLTTGSVDVPRGAPRAYLGGDGFGLALSRLGDWKTDAYAELPAGDLPDVDAAEHVRGVLTLTVGLITGGRGEAVQVTYDSRTRRWRDHRPLVVFPEAQGVDVGDAGPAGALVVLGLPWNGTAHDPETGLYWVRPGKPVRHLLQRIRELRTIALPDGFVAMFEDEFSADRRPDDPSDMYVLRARGDELALYRFPRPGPCSASHFVRLGETRFVATFCSHQAVEFELP